jgi:hypothetical protein
LKTEDIARVCHEVNRAYCQAIGDFSQAPWDEAPQWQKDSAIAGVKHALANPNTTPEQSHESWLAQKRADGWTWGPKKNPDVKLHPCFRPYAELPTEQKVKDYLFLAICRALSKEDGSSAAAIERDALTAAMLHWNGGSFILERNDLERVKGTEIVRITGEDKSSVTYRLRPMKVEEEAVVISIPAA